MEIIMLPCLRAGYHHAISDFRVFFDSLKNIPPEIEMAITDKLIKMMTEKRNIDWPILREEQAVAIDDVIKKRDSVEGQV
jgi:hypothetical protein